MKVHHIANDVCLEKGGTQRLVRQIHESLVAQGLNSQIVALCHSVEDVQNATTLSNSSPYSLNALASVFNYIHQQCSADDIIHAHLFPSLLYVSISVKLLRWKGHLVCTEHNTSNRRRQHRFGSLIDSLIYPSYQHIYCISQGTLDSLKSWMPSVSSKLKLIENGVLLAYQEFLEREDREKIIVVSAGRLHAQKNYEAALESIALLLRKGMRNVEYRIAGVGEQEPALRALSSELQLEENVKFYGYVEDIFGFFEQADIFLMPSRWEGFGLAVIEAMNAGLPAVASDVAGIREIFEVSDQCGILVSPDCPDDIAEAVERLCNKSVRISMGRAAFKRSLSFSLENMTKKYIREYQELA